MRVHTRLLLTRFPRLKTILKRLRSRWLPLTGVSTHYESLHMDQAVDESSRLRGAWKDEELPRRQRELVNAQLAAYRRGEAIDVFDVMTDALRTLPLGVQGMSVLEVGCSSGFYSEVFEIADLGVCYVGCDYSDAFIAMAGKTYPALQFDIADATALPYKQNAFDIVISGCCLLHIPEYHAAVAETARVATRYAIFHRTPMVLGQPTQYFRKKAYGVETVEIHFNEPEFLMLLTVSGLEVIKTYSLDEMVHGGVGSANRTYVCRKINAL
jgi:SAM-dependent methyltransferase